MRRIAIFAIALLMMPPLMHSADAASGGFQSGRSGSATAGARIYTPGRSAFPRTGIPRPGLSRTAVPHGQIPRFGNMHRDFARRGFRSAIGTGVIIGAPLLEPVDPFWFGYDSFAYPDEYAPLYPPEVYAAPQPYLPPAPVYPASSGEGPSQPIWYYCQNPMGYYPTVQNCNTDWQAVPGSVLPPPAPQQ